MVSNQKPVSNDQDMCKNELTMMAREMMAVYHKYNPGGGYLSFCYIDGHFEMHNMWWSEDKDFPIRMKGRWGK